MRDKFELDRNTFGYVDCWFDSVVSGRIHQRAKEKESKDELYLF